MRMIWDLPLSWLLLPLKLILVVPFYILQQIRNLIKKKNPKYWGKEVSPIRNYWDVLIDQLKASPVYEDESISLYTLCVPINSKPSGDNHHTAHQCMRQGLWVNLMSRFRGGAKDKEIIALEKHWHNGELARGYSIDKFGKYHFNHDEVSGDMLAGFVLGYVSEPKKLAYTMIKIGEHLVKNKGLLSMGRVSKRANFLPGWQFGSETPMPVGAQNITYLVGLKCAIDAYSYYSKEDRKILGLNSYWTIKLEYLKRFYLYLDCLTILMPTVGVWFRRGYNNDNCCIHFAYVGTQVSSFIERLIYEISLIYTWSLAWPWLNGFHTGMAYEATGLITESYMNRCRAYAEDFIDIYTGTQYGPNNKVPAPYWPQDPEKRTFDEFLCDENQEYDRSTGKRKYRSTIGQIAQILWTRQ